MLIWTISIKSSSKIIIFKSYALEKTSENVLVNAQAK